MALNNGIGGYCFLGMLLHKDSDEQYTFYVLCMDEPTHVPCPTLSAYTELSPKDMARSDVMKG